MTTVNWDDANVRAAVRKAAATALNKVGSDCVKDAKDNVPVRTGALDGSIGIHQPAQPGDAGPILMVWGSADINYALGVELGDKSLIPATSIFPRQPVRGSPRNSGRIGFLRAAADKFYPELAARIASEMPK